MTLLAKRSMGVGRAGAEAGDDMPKTELAELGELGCDALVFVPDGVAAVADVALAGDVAAPL